MKVTPKNIPIFTSILYSACVIAVCAAVDVITDQISKLSDIQDEDHQHFPSLFCRSFIKIYIKV